MITRPIVAAALALALSACVPATPVYLTAPANPSLGTGTPGYRPVTAGIADYDVVEPLDWRELNRRVAPRGAFDDGDAAGQGQ